MRYFWDWLAVSQQAPLLTLSALASGSCRGRDGCLRNSLSNDLLLTNTSRTSKYFSWQEQQPIKQPALAPVTRAPACTELQTELPDPPSQHKHLHLYANWRNNTDERRETVFAIGYSVGTQSSTVVSFILLWLQYGFNQNDPLELNLISHRALNLTETCETLPSFWHCPFSKLIKSFHLILTLSSLAAVVLFPFRYCP